MKKLTTIACSALLLCSGLAFAGCDKTKDFDKNNITLGEQTVIYNGQNQIFDVTYSGVDANVTYSVNGTEFYPADEMYLVAGSYNVYYKLSADGYKDYVGGPVAYQINEKDIRVKIKNVVDYYQNVRTEANILNNIMLEYANPADLMANDVLNINYDILNFSPQNAQLNDVYQIQGVDADPRYNIIVETGTYRVADAVSVLSSTSGETYYTSVEEAMANATENDVIRLNTDRTEALIIDATTADIKFTLDLNGYNIANGIKLRSYTTSVDEATDFGIEANIINTSNRISTVGSGAAYGIMVNGNVNFNVTLSDINFVGSECGMATNGKFEYATIKAENCKFGNEHTKSGAYLPANYVYEFENCSFTGLTGYYAKSGVHTVTNCKVWGTKIDYTAPKFNNNGSEETGSAMVIDSAQGYFKPMLVTVIGGEFHSVAGYGIEECVTGAEQDYANVNLSGNIDYDVAKQNFKLINEYTPA